MSNQSKMDHSLLMVVVALFVLGAVSSPAAGPGFGEVIPMTSMRRVIARRMSESFFGAPHVYFFTDVCMDPLLKLRKDILPDFDQPVLGIVKRKDSVPSLGTAPNQSINQDHPVKVSEMLEIYIPVAPENI